MSKISLNEVVIIKPKFTHISNIEPRDTALWRTGRIKSQTLKTSCDCDGNYYNDVVYEVERCDDDEIIYMRRDGFFTYKEMIKTLKRDGWILASLVNQLKIQELKRDDKE